MKIVPTPEDQKRQEKLMRRIRVADDADNDTVPPTPRQQKKIKKAFLKIIKDTIMDDESPEAH